VNDAFGRPQSVVVLGGTSDIAGALVALWAARCRSLVVAGRDEDRLDKVAARFGASIASVATVVFDATKDDADTTITRCFAAAAEAVDVVVMAVGELGDQEVDEHDPGRIARMLSVNFAWPAAALSATAAILQKQGHGRIVVLSSVAGVRVRRANFVYGSAKYGLDGFAQGLSEALEGSGVSLHLVRPGFVRTKMTEGRPAAPFAVDADRVAADVVAGLEHNRRVIWSPPVVGWVFSVLRHLPRPLWRRLPG
jgi:decaprenylphospho-beta-D-erythro-pentofuranosid-2-ulose 2-reductase